MYIDCDHPGVNNTTNKCIKCGEDWNILFPEHNLINYIEIINGNETFKFKKPKFKIELLKVIGDTIVGYYCTKDGTVYSESWSIITGRADINENKDNICVHLKSIK